MQSFIVFITISVLCNVSLFAQVNLQDLINSAENNDTIFLQEGIYEANPSDYFEEQCGNCTEHQTGVHGSRGFLIEDKTIHIIGINKENVVLKTNAGYGVLFYNSRKSSISNLTISGGIRDTSGNATNGGIVLKYSTVTIKNCIISNDTVRTGNLPVVGVCGIVIREDSDALIENNLIRNNTWDGIALYRGGSARIINNIIENGRGAGIGITWDSKAYAFGNRVSGFWKGIGTFGNSRAILVNNAVFDNLGWGIVISGNSGMIIENNVITRNGNCGIAPWCDSTESVTALITNNIITENGWRKEWVCPQVGIWMNSPPNHIRIACNNVWNNYSGNYKDIEDMTGKNGNISIDPQFNGKFDFTLSETSPLNYEINPKNYCRMGIDEDRIPK